MEKWHEHVTQYIYTFKFRYTVAQGQHKSLRLMPNIDLVKLFKGPKVSDTDGPTFKSCMALQNYKKNW